MCGITGYWGLPLRAEESNRVIGRMTAAISHRGPDAEGYWVSNSDGIGLGHRRLSIQDLSTSGAQPMCSNSGRYVLVFNGEIYNFSKIKKILSETGHCFRGNSDTEVLLTLIDSQGLDQALSQITGMFAFCLWDKKNKTLYLVRDRLGEKPLYYGVLDGALVFASELKSIKQFPGFTGEISRDVLASYLRFNYVPSPHCIFDGFNKLPPGSVATFTNFPFGEKRIHQYWSVLDAVNAPRFEVSRREAIEGLDRTLSESIKDKMIADVSLGAFLSGGVDSSLIVAMMQKQSSSKVKTYTIGFEDTQFNEAVFARQVAHHLGTDHTELYINAQTAQEVIPKLPTIYDEPFADSSQIPTYLVSKLARSQVTVALSGDGGDELFGGYTRYSWADRVWDTISILPQPSRRVLKQILRSMPLHNWNGFGPTVSNRLPALLNQSHPGQKLQKLSNVLDAKSIRDVYARLVSQVNSPNKVVLHSSESASVLDETSIWNLSISNPEKMMLMDQMSYLPDDILTKVDRASMSMGLETRVPFLDHRVVDYAWRIPIEYKISDGSGKWILKQVLNRYVPENLMNRPKIGFSVPIGQWLCGPLRSWAEELLSAERLLNDGYFDHGLVSKMWLEHKSGKRNWQNELWGILMFQSWIIEQKQSHFRSRAA